jgi:transposase
LGKQDFVSMAQDDEYRCAAGQRLIKRFTSGEHGMNLHRYWSSVCQGCPIKAQCTPDKERRIKRWEHEELLDVMQARLERDPEKMQVRRQTVEHPFGTLKSWMGSTHFLTSTRDRVSTEMSLPVLAYHLKRVMKLVGISAMIEVIKACGLLLRSIRFLLKPHRVRVEKLLAQRSRAEL